ncbi:excisionase family DNA-binding protein [Sinorhizobium meliloti]|uniref:excisionase family DNA-binding protein n=1 Tax=Rhizobium meliloti TaxID=382 RepID=UPI002073003C|nr:excisionase family DNA-binding protein [Sinorhizobium meliloti]MCM5691443.1 excisionase family DNA-binding protein [Sinorhizobium meliloti]
MSIFVNLAQNPVKQKNEKEKKMEAANDNLAADMLRGADAIATYMGLPRRSVYHAISRGHLPHFRIGETVCARKSTLLRWLGEQEAAARVAA